MAHSSFAANPSHVPIEAKRATPDHDFWRERRVLVTGHTGFKGSWLCTWLSLLGAEVHGLALPPPAGGHFLKAGTEASMALDIRGDIRDLLLVKRAFQQSSPEIVFHLAAQPIVSEGYDNPIETVSTNVLGTAHILEACREAKHLGSLVVVTTDKCYENSDAPWPMRETDRLGGADPYSSSKACAELITKSFVHSYLTSSGVRASTARAGNVIGGGDVGRDRLVPHLLSALASDQSVVLRHPDAVRPWQHVLDALSGYLVLAQRLFQKDAHVADAYNFAPSAAEPWTVARIAQEMSRIWGKTTTLCRHEPNAHYREAKSLRLDASLAARDLGWRARLDTASAIGWTVEWERSAMDGQPAHHITREQINRVMTMRGRDHDAR